MTVFIEGWDWKEQPDIARIAEAVEEMSKGTVHIYEVDTRSDQYAIVISDVVLDSEAVEREYLGEW